MQIDELIKKRRSIRKFKQKTIEINVLKELIDCGRLAPSAANIQPLEYVIINKNKLLSEVFDTLKWAAYIEPEGNPSKNKRPVAYIIVLVNKDKEKFPAQHDVGAAIENILLAGLSKGIAGCWLGAIDRESLFEKLKLDKNYRIDSVIALGYPDQKSLTEDWQGDVKYWQDSNSNMHVPKRGLEDIIYSINYE